MKSGSRIDGLGWLLATGICLATWAGTPARAEDHWPGLVCTLSNAADGNELVVFARDEEGRLSAAGAVATGGLGLGSGLGSQGALSFGSDPHVLYAVNAGSHNLSAFASAGRCPR